MSEQPCLLQINLDGIATLSLNRPDVHNALDETTVDLLIKCLHELEENTLVRAIVLTSTGKNFCSGADLKWMLRSDEHMAEGEDSVAQKLAELMQVLHSHFKPTIALVTGATYGGGAGLVACCDIALASRDAHFCFSEVRLGLIPSVISPYVIRAIGERLARRYFLTAEHFDAQEAYRIGLVHEVVEESNFQHCLNKITEALIAGGPCALTRTKELVDVISTAALDDSLIRKTVEWIAEVRKTPEAKEGMSAFIKKRTASWLKGAKGKS